jgi:hypothetical protein
VADEQDRNVLAFRREQQLCCRFANLPDAAGRRLELQREDRLDRIDDRQRGPDAGDLLEDALEAGFGEQEERRAGDAASAPGSTIATIRSAMAPDSPPA